MQDISAAAATSSSSTSSRPHPPRRSRSSFHNNIPTKTTTKTTTTATTTAKQKIMLCTRLHIQSATYGPAEGRRLFNGMLVDYHEKETYVPYTRDVLPFLKALMSLMSDEEDLEEEEEEEKGGDFEKKESDAFGLRPGEENAHEKDDDEVDNHHEGDLYGCSRTDDDTRFRVLQQGNNSTNAFALMDGRPMNAVFGDPCPGTTKLLRVEYSFRDYFYDGGEIDNATIEGECGIGIDELGKRRDHDDGGRDNSLKAVREEVDLNNGKMMRQNQRRRQQRQRRRYHCKTSRLFQSTFREHERVLLKRQDPLFRLTMDDTHGDCSNEADPENAAKIDDESGTIPISSSSTIPQSSAPSTASPSSSSSPSKQWKLAPTTSEITLPIILPFLTIHQRAKCQMVCRSWKSIVLDRGIAVVVDVNDVGLFPLSKDRMMMDVAPTTTGATGAATATIARLRIPHYPPFGGRSFGATDNDAVDAASSSYSPNNVHIQQQQHQHPSRSLLRGLLNHSHSSLEALVLNDFCPLHPVIDLHPALPHLRKLKRLDISRVPSITDDTLHLLSSFVGKRLEVLYMKGLRHVTNEGIVRLVKSCSNLRVLDVSQVNQLDDTAGVAIGTHLTKLEVFHSRDCHKMTNRSVDLITRNCCSLIQGTFWGCIRLTHVCFGGGDDDDDDRRQQQQQQCAENDGDADAATAMDGGTFANSTFQSATTTTATMPRPSPSFTNIRNTSTAKNLTLLNLWGCHNLTDAAALRMTNLTRLRSLCVSECHRLTDKFVTGVTESLNQLLHLQLRYLRRITDASLEYISHRMSGLYSLDVSFCTKLTVGGLARLLTEKCSSLSELRLYSCRQLDVEGGSLMMMNNGGGGGRNNNNGGNNGHGGVGGGRRFVQALRSLRGRSILSLLDLRECQHHEPFARDDVFLDGMAGLGFDETLHGLFVRPARWNGEVMRQLVANLSDAGGT